MEAAAFKFGDNFHQFPYFSFILVCCHPYKICCSELVCGFLFTSMWYVVSTRILKQVITLLGDAKIKQAVKPPL